jgi:hypothetical protein
MWERLRAERNATIVEDDDSEYDISVTDAAEEFDDPIGPLAQYVKLAHANGWTIHALGHSKAFAKGKPFKTGANEGQPRPDQHIEQQWGYFVRDRNVVEVSYMIVNGTPRGNMTVRRLNRVAMADRDLKNAIKAEA